VKIAFMGSDPIALPALAGLRREQPGGCELAMVFTQPDRRHGRGMKLRPNRIKEWALAEGLPVRQPERCGEEDAESLREAGVEAALVMAYGQLLRRAFLDALSGRFYNLHASDLPRLRGASPIETAVAAGLRQTAVSFMRIIPAMDAGPVAEREFVSIGPEETAPELREKIAAACPRLLRRCLPALRKGTLAFADQEEREATYCRMIGRADAHLDFRTGADELANRIRALQPWPGTSFPYEDTELRVHAAASLPETPAAAPGTLLHAGEGDLRIACGEGQLQLHRLQRPGGKALSVADFLRGFPLQEGKRLPSREMPPLEAKQPFGMKKKSAR
jgi:methionyl-tRNA formyltransferase